MRTTVSLDEDVFLAVKERAHRENRSAGAVLSDLVRQALTQRPVASPSGEPDDFYGFAPFPNRGPMVTNDLIDELMNDDSE